MTLEPKKIKSVTASTFSPFICHEVMGPDAMILGFWMLSFKPAFSLSLGITYVDSLYKVSTLSHIQKVSFWKVSTYCFCHVLWCRQVSSLVSWVETGHTVYYTRPPSHSWLVTCMIQWLESRWVQSKFHASYTSSTTQTTFSQESRLVVLDVSFNSWSD